MVYLITRLWPIIYICYSTNYIITAIVGWCMCPIATTMIMFPLDAWKRHQLFPPHMWEQRASAVACASNKACSRCTLMRLGLLNESWNVDELCCNSNMCTLRDDNSNITMKALSRSVMDTVARGSDSMYCALKWKHTECSLDKFQMLKFQVHYEVTSNNKNTWLFWNWHINDSIKAYKIMSIFTIIVLIVFTCPRHDSWFVCFNVK